METHACALVLGSYVNAYLIVRELYSKGVKDIILIDHKKNLAAYSNRILRFERISKRGDAILQSIKRIGEVYDQVIVFPTDDEFLEQLSKYHDELKKFCFLPFNNGNLSKSIEKMFQYRQCEKLGIPYPRTLEIKGPEDFGRAKDLPFPIIIKPIKKPRADLPGSFRLIFCESHGDYEKQMPRVVELIGKGSSFVAQEAIPGDDSCLYTYVAYRDKNGEILNEWAGGKLSQYPRRCGVFSSASNQAPEEIIKQGRDLVNGMDVYGISAPEFKYDYRDSKFKLIEINLRATMWNRIGALSGVEINYTQYLDAIGQKAPKQKQDMDKEIHLVYLKHELLNLINNKGYYKVFLHNLFKSDKTYFPVFDIKDLRPFYFDLMMTFKSVYSIYLGLLKGGANIS